MSPRADEPDGSLSLSLFLSLPPALDFWQTWPSRLSEMRTSTRTPLRRTDFWLHSPGWFGTTGWLVAAVWPTSWLKGRQDCGLCSIMSDIVCLLVLVICLSVLDASQNLGLKNDEPQHYGLASWRDGKHGARTPGSSMDNILVVTETPQDSHTRG